MTGMRRFAALLVASRGRSWERFRLGVHYHN